MASLCAKAPPALGLPLDGRLVAGAPDAVVAASLCAKAPPALGLPLDGRLVAGAPDAAGATLGVR